MNAFSFSLKEFLRIILQVMKRISHIDFHALQVAFVSKKLSEHLYPEHVEPITIVAFLHDIGFLMPRYLRSIEKLPSEETFITLERLLKFDHSIKAFGKMHSLFGKKLIRYLPIENEYGNAIALHHTSAEQLDVKNKVHVIANIIHLADFISLSTLKQNFDYDRVKELISEVTASSDYFPHVVSAFKEIFYPEAPWFLLFEYNDLVEQLLYGTKRILSYAELEHALDVLVFLVDHKSPFTRKHTESVVFTASEIASELDLTDDEIISLKLAAKVHDVGKMATPVKILEKPSNLDQKELWIMRKHVYDSYSILGGEKSCMAHEWICWATEHHERLDGSGYPFKKNAKELSLPSRILMVADMLVAIVEDRPYRKSMTLEEALKILQNDALNGKLDVDVVKTVEKMIKNGFHPILERGVSEEILEEIQKETQVESSLFQHDLIE
ncbi:MAG: hypothetical protein PWP37_721 [Thermotogota bacterium]|nr:hypothetical protein [Thermotogota bacterium]MDK2864529.1 hypothetical protein [Thermotogota bacterium]